MSHTSESPSELRSLQLCVLEIFKCVHKLCVDNNIRYSLCGGSVVGAHLYAGFLPWDDDIDLMLTRENYDKLINVCKKQLPPYYRLVNYKTCDEYPTLFSKIIDTRTTLIQVRGDGSRQISGVFMDFTCYDRIPHNYTQYIVKFLYLISQWAYSATYQESPCCTKGRIKNLWLSIFGQHPTWLYRLSERIFKWSGRARKYHYSELFGAYANTIAYAPHVFENYTTILFEGLECMIVRDYIEYLQTRYNRTNFHEPLDKRVPPHYAYVDLNTPYETYEQDHT